MLGAVIWSVLPTAMLQSDTTHGGSSMAMLGCFLWWVLLGGLLGWLASWLLGKAHEGAAPAPIERIVDRPVDRIVEKIVEKPVDRIVELKVDNPDHIASIARLTAEVAVVAALRKQIADLAARPPQIVEKIVEKPVDRIVEKIVEKPVDRIVEKIVEKPVDRIVEKIVEKPVDRIVEKVVEIPVDRVVERLVPDQKALETRDREIIVLNARIDDLTNSLGDRDVEITRFRSGPELDLAAARAAGFAVKGADNLEIIEGIGPKIADLLRADGITTFYKLSNSTPALIRAILDKAGPTFRIAEPGTWPEQAGYAVRNQWRELARLQKEELDAGVRRSDGAPLAALKTQLAERDAEILRLITPRAIDLVAAKAAGFSMRGDDDLEIIEGIGPKVAELLRVEGMRTFAELAVAPISRIQGVLDRGGPNFRLAKPETWPEQSALAADNHWRALKALQDVLTAGNR